MRSMFVIALLVTASAVGVRAAEPAPDADAVQAAMEQMSRTGAEHEALARTVGDWQVRSTMWMSPDAEPVTSSDTATIESILDGKWIRQQYRGTMMGQAFNGVLLSGYDTVAEQYVGVWIDSFSTGLTHMTGTSEDGGKTIVYHARLEHCPMTGGPLDQRYVVQIESDDRFTMECYHTPEGGEEALAMRLVYSRHQPEAEQDQQAEQQGGMAAEPDAQAPESGDTAGE